MTANTGTIAERVARGAAWLDETRPDWWQKIDLSELELTSTCNCVLGQLWKIERPDDWCFLDQPFQRAVRAWAPVADGGPWAQQYGFDAQPRHWDYDDLQSEWKRIITERRAAADSGA